MKESVKQIWCQLNQGMLAEGNFIIFHVQTLLLQNIDVSREPVCFYLWNTGLIMPLTHIKIIWLVYKFRTLMKRSVHNMPPSQVDCLKTAA